VDAPQQPSPKLSARVVVVASDDGSVIQAAREGWVLLEFANSSNERVSILTGCLAGKAGRSGPPSYSEHPYYSGFGVCRFKYTWASQEGGPTAGGFLDPPDNPLVLGPRGTVQVWRRILAPSAPGEYRLQVVLDLAPVSAILETYNNRSPTAPEQTGSISCGAADVRIRP
jgi:hypothetical protein